jgi:DNA-binding MarR family transcriptional regulator
MKKPDFTKLLAILAHGPLPGVDLMDELEMDRSTLATLIEAAERAGFVEWDAKGNPKLRLTEAGKEAQFSNEE